MTQPFPHLHPLNAGEILDRAFGLYRANFWLFIQIGAVVLGPLFLLELVSFSFIRDARFIFVLQSFLTVYLLYGAMIWAVASAYLGSYVTLGDAFYQATYYFKSFFGANFRQALVYLPPVILWAIGAGLWFWWVLGEVSTRPPNNVVMMCLVSTSLVLLPYVSFFSTRWLLVFPAIMLEDLDAGKGLARSWALTAKDFWHVFVIFIASAILAYLLILLPASIIGSLIGLFSKSTEINPVLSYGMSQLGVLISVPLNMSILVILYYDLRVRREGYDLVLEMKAEDARKEQ